jgi:hypothetical protein
VDLNNAAWRTSSHSGGNGGQCVQVAALAARRDAHTGVCAVRDSKNPDGPVLAFSPRQWRWFTADIKTRTHDDWA